MNKIYICDICNKQCDGKISNNRHSPNFSGDKSSPGEMPSFYFCSELHRKEWVSNVRKLDNKNLPFLAELDESMNYCEYFIRTNGNEGVYKKDGFTYNVNGLWDYKSFNLEKAKYFKKEYIKYFGNFERFTLHNRYIKD